MIKCNVCQIEKEENNFQQYWHSTQQKMRQRKQCTECYYQIRLKRKNPDRYYENNPNYHKCNTCNNWKEKIEFYITSENKIYSNRCRVCTKELDKLQREEKLADSCGSEKVLRYPNQYTDKYQRSCTFDIMLHLGYIYDEPSGHWLKPGYKELNEEGKLIFPTLSKRKRIFVPKGVMTEERIEKLFQMKEQGYSYEKMAQELKISDTTVWKYLNGKTYKSG